MDIYLKDCKLSERTRGLKEAYFKAMPETCLERARLITTYSLEHGLFEKDKISILDKARMYRFALANRTPVVWHTGGYAKGMVPFKFTDTSLFAGSTTSRFKGVPLYPEFLALTIWPELWTISKRSANPFFLSEEDAKELNFKIFPHWMEENITELARARSYRENAGAGDRCAPEMKLMERLVFFLASKPECISHTIPDFSKAIYKGLRGVINEAKARGEAATDASKKEFYQAISEVMEGIIAYSKNLAQKAREMAAGETDQGRKAELLEIARINEKIPEQRAETFREGLTAVWICWTAIHLENPNVGLSLGRLDQVLFDLYRKDVSSGKLTADQAVELLSCLWLKIGDHVPCIPEAGEQLFGGTGSNQAITIGGVDKEGRDAVNDLTYVMLRATELMRLRDPNLNARYYPGINSKEYLKRLCDVNVTTGATPAIHNDRAVISALMSKGETLEQARDYGVIGCVEPNSAGRTYGHTGAILLNLTSVLELALYNGRHRHTGMDLRISPPTGELADFKTFDEFTAAFGKQLNWLIGHAVNLNNIFGKIHQDFYPTPILSALFEGPMEKGMDVIQGGAALNSSGATIIGLADVADSLSAIKKIVFDEKKKTFPELISAVDNNFKDDLPLLVELTTKAPKYGNENKDADGNVTWLLETINKAFDSKQNYRGGGYRVGYWTMTNHAGFGRLTEALPSGRKARENFTSGITPVSGVTPELAKALHSVAKQPARYLSSGVALNLKYTPECGPDNKDEALKDAMLGRFAASVEGYFSGLDGNPDGGMEIQFNITTHDTFIKAVKNPGDYPELLVRVSGYTAYFKDLNPQMQKEIIDRTEYLLSTGSHIPYEPFDLGGDNSPC